MATWLAHLRVAELISAELRAPWLSEPDFLAGNVAPDCGIPVPGGFDPPKEVTHWTQRGKGHCDYERFYREMIAGKSHDPHTLSFLLGYYCHLMADVLWGQARKRTMQGTPPRNLRRRPRRILPPG